MPELLEVEIFAVGTWVGSMGPMKWSADDMDSIIKNTNALMNSDEFKIVPKLKLGHSSEQIFDDAQILEGQYNGDPALGKVINFRTVGSGDNKKIVADFVSVPDVIHMSIIKELYTNVSAELEFSKGVGWFISAVALLGADIPAVKTLDDLQAFLSDQSADISAGNFHLCFTQPKITGGIMPDPIKKEDEGNSTDPAISKLLDTNSTLSAKVTETETELGKVKKESADKDAELQGYKKQVLEQKFIERKSAIVTPYVQDVKDKKLMPVLLDKINTYLDSQKAGFSEESVLNLTPELSREITEGYINMTVNHNDSGEGGGSFNDDGSTEISADEVVEKECKVIMAANPHMNYSEASEHLILTKPEIWKNYCDYTESVSQLGKVPQV